MGDLNGLLYLIEGLVREPKHGIAVVSKEGLEAADESPWAEVVVKDPGNASEGAVLGGYCIWRQRVKYKRLWRKIRLW